MRIGEFAKMNSTTIDTVRHYMSLNLIFPEKKHSQYDFDNRCQSDFDDILRFKTLGFSLQEIQTFMAFKRIGRLSGYEKSLYYQSLFEQRLSELDLQIQTLTDSKELLASEISTLKSTSFPTRPFGVPLSCLSLVICPKCGGNMMLDRAQVKMQQVVNGLLVCPCGENLTISDGILIAQGAKKQPHYFQSDITDVYLDEYIEKTDPDYLTHLYKTFEWGYKNIPIADFQDSSFLEIGIGHGFFLRYCFEKMHPSIRYVAVDHDIDKLKWLSYRLSRTPMPFDIMLIACDFTTIPLRNQSIDLLLDISGSSNYAFDHTEFLLPQLLKYMKTQAPLLSGYLLFENFGKQSKISPEYRPNFRLTPVLESLKSLGFEEQLSYRSDFVHKGGVYENFFTDGERVFSYLYYGVRNEPL